MAHRIVKRRKRTTRSIILALLMGAAALGAGRSARAGEVEDHLRKIKEAADCRSRCNRASLSCMARCANGDTACRSNCLLESSNCSQSCD